MTKTRNYSCKDVEMLMASQTIAYSFKANIDELSVVRTDWTASYADDLVTRVDTTLQKYLGIDAKQELRSATVALTAVQGSAQKDLSFLKAQLDDDFKKDPARRDEILKVLGFAKHLRDVQKNNQEALTQLLFTFKNNVTEQLTQEIVAKGTNPALLERIAGYADTFKQANLSQETNKSASKEVTREAADALNAIYDEISGLCKKASVYYRDQPVKKEQFTFSKVIANLGASTSKAAAKTGTPVANAETTTTK